MDCFLLVQRAKSIYLTRVYVILLSTITTPSNLNFNFKSGETVQAVEAHDVLGKVFVQPDDRYFYTAGADGLVKNWDLRVVALPPPAHTSAPSLRRDCATTRAGAQVRQEVALLLHASDVHASHRRRRPRRILRRHRRHPHQGPTSAPSVGSASSPVTQAHTPASPRAAGRRAAAAGLRLPPRPPAGLRHPRRRQRALRRLQVPRPIACPLRMRGCRPDPRTAPRRRSIPRRGGVACGSKVTVDATAAATASVELYTAPSTGQYSPAAGGDRSFRARGGGQSPQRAAPLFPAGPRA